MPTPLELLTKPLQIGAQVAFGAIQNIQKVVQGLSGGDQQHDEPPPHQKLQREEQERQGQRPAPAAQRRQAQPKPLDDVTITRKVETVLFRDDSIDKGKIDVNTADGVVTLRGVAKTPEQIKELEARAREIPEVKDVENVLHLPKTPARRPKSKTTAAARKRAPKRTTAERKATPAKTAAEPAPKELAQKREGRQPAPLGASDNGSGETTSGS